MSLRQKARLQISCSKALTLETPPIKALIVIIIISQLLVYHDAKGKKRVQVMQDMRNE